MFASVFTHQRPLQVEGLGVLTQQHHVLLQVVQAAVFVAPDPLLMDGGNKMNDPLTAANLSQHEQSCRCFNPHLDLPEVHRFADELVVLGQLLTRRQLNEDFTQLSPITAETRQV